MHAMQCGCGKCRAARAAFAVEPFRLEVAGETDALLNEADELELAMELLAVSSEAEWDQFLGKLFRGIGRGLKKFGSFVGKRILRPLGRALKAVAKKALPFVGGALGSLIPIPGVGTAVGTALGTAVGKALELEYGGRGGEQSELEMARRFVRIAASAARGAALAPPGIAPEAAVRDALIAAARRHLPNFDPGAAGRIAASGSARPLPASGRWLRQGRHIMVLGI